MHRARMIGGPKDGEEVAISELADRLKYVRPLSIQPHSPEGLPKQIELVYHVYSFIGVDGSGSYKYFYEGVFRG